MATQVQSPLDFVEQPVTAQADLPASGYIRLYANTDGSLYLRTSAGVSTQIGGSAAVPTYIADGSTYSVADSTQITIALISIDGDLALDGYMGEL